MPGCLIKLGGGWNLLADDFLIPLRNETNGGETRKPTNRTQKMLGLVKLSDNPN